MWNPFRIFNRKTSEPRGSVSQTFISGTASGVTVGEAEALKSSAVYAGIRYHAQTVGQLPWDCYESFGAGAKLLNVERYSGVKRILNNRVNDNLTSQRFREIMTMHAFLYGNGVAEIERDNAGRALNLFVLRPERIRFEFNERELLFHYQDPRGGARVLRSDEVFHIANYGERPDFSPVGASVIQHAAESIGWHRATELFGAAYFKNGIHPSVAITLKNSLSPAAYKVFEETYMRKFSGSDGAHKPFITDGEAKIEKLSIRPDESQFTETLNYQIDDIARWLGVPPSKIGHLIHSGVRANVEHASIEVVQDYTMPWVIRFEQEANQKLFRERESHITRMDLSALLRGDSKSRAEYYRTMTHIGAFSVNDVRAMEDMNPIGPDGDQHLVQGQYMPLGDVGRQQEVLNDGSNENPTAQAQDGSQARTRGAGESGKSSKHNHSIKNEIANPPVDTAEIERSKEWEGVRRTLNL